MSIKQSNDYCSGGKKERMLIGLKTIEFTEQFRNNCTFLNQSEMRNKSLLAIMIIIGLNQCPCISQKNDINQKQFKRFSCYSKSTQLVLEEDLLYIMIKEKKVFVEENVVFFAVFPAK